MTYTLQTHSKHIEAHAKDILLTQHTRTHAVYTHLTNTGAWQTPDKRIANT